MTLTDNKDTKPIMKSTYILAVLFTLLQGAYSIPQTSTNGISGTNDGNGFVVDSDGVRVGGDRGSVVIDREGVDIDRNRSNSATGYQIFPIVSGATIAAASFFLL